MGLIQTGKIAGTVYILQSISIRGGLIRRLAVWIGEKGIREVKVYACSFWCNKDNHTKTDGLCVVGFSFLSVSRFLFLVSC